MSKAARVKFDVSFGAVKHRVDLRACVSSVEGFELKFEDSDAEYAYEKRKQNALSRVLDHGGPGV